MKKFILFITMFIMIGISSKATSTVSTLYTGPLALGAWANYEQISKSNFASASVGDIITVNVSNVLTDGKGVLQTSKNWTNLTGTSDYTLSTDQTSYSLTITADQLSELQSYDLVVKGQNYTVESVTLTHTDASTVTTTLFSDVNFNVGTGGWTSEYNIPSSVFTNLIAGDLLKFNVTRVTGDGYYSQYQFCYYVDGTANIIGNSYTDFSSSSFTFTITSENLSALRTYGLFVKGRDYTINSVDLIQPVVNTVEVGTTGYATFCSEKNCSVPSGITAFVASNYSGGNVTLSSIDGIPASTGVILKGTASTTYYFTETGAILTAPATNYLVGVTAATTVSQTDGTNTNFILTQPSGYSLGFYKVIPAGGTLAANKAYLKLATSSLPTEAKSLSINFDVTPSGINTIKDNDVNSNLIYNISGQRVYNPTKGLYIVNGKKVIFK